MPNTLPFGFRERTYEELTEDFFDPSSLSGHGETVYREKREEEHDNQDF